MPLNHDTIIDGHIPYIYDMRASIKKMSQPSNLRGFLAILRDFSLIGIIIAINLRFENILLYSLSIWLIGAMQFALSECLLHEASHYTLFRSRKLNDLCEILVALPFLQTIRSFRAEHRLHHTHLMKDSDTLTTEYKYYGLDRDHVNVTWIWFIKPLIGYSAIMMARGGQSMASKKDICKILCFWIATTLVAHQFHIASDILYFWIIPLVFCKGSFLYWSEISDHWRTKSGIRSRTGYLANILFHNNGYHHVHHRHPSITQFNLKKAHPLLRRDGDDISHGFLDTYRQIRSFEA